MSAIANDNANKAAPVESVIKNGRPTPPETQTSSDAKAPDLPPITKEPLETAAATMVPVPTGEPNKETAPAPAPAPAEKNDPAIPSGGDPQQQEPDAKEPSANAGSLPKGDNKEPPKPVSIEEVPDRELPKAHPPSPPAEAKLEEAKPEEAKPEEAKPEEAKPAEVKPAEVKPEEAEPEEAKLDGTDENVDDAAPSGVAMNDALPPQPEAETEAKAEPAMDVEKPEGPVADAPETAAAKTEPQTGDKRKADEAAVSNGDASAEAAPESQEAVAAEKKLKTDEAPVPVPAVPAAAATAATNGSPKKPGRPKKSDKPPAPATPVGRTARKTRSQGAAE